MIGELSRLYVYGTNFLVSPWLAWTSVRPAFSPCADEVDEVLELSLTDLIDHQRVGRFHRQIRGITFSAPRSALGNIASGGRRP